MTISKDIKFDCAHMLSNYEGKCSNLHGHTYHGTVTLEGNVNPETGMLLDYNRIKEVVDVFDHAIIFSAPEFRDEAEENLYKWAVHFGMRSVVLTEGKSTAENMAVMIAQALVAEPGVNSVQVHLSETDGSWATVEAYK